MVLCIWTAYIIFSCYGLSNVEVDFKTTYFIGKGAYVRTYLDKQDEFFKAGDAVTIYFDNVDKVDFSKKRYQQGLATFNENLKQCKGCEEAWVLEDSFESWYEKWLSYVKTF